MNESSIKHSIKNDILTVWLIGSNEDQSMKHPEAEILLTIHTSLIDSMTEVLGDALHSITETQHNKRK